MIFFYIFHDETKHEKIIFLSIFFLSLLLSGFQTEPKETHIFLTIFLRKVTGNIQSYFPQYFLLKKKISFHIFQHIQTEENYFPLYFFFPFLSIFPSSKHTLWVLLALHKNLFFFFRKNLFLSLFHFSEKIP